MVQPVTSVLVAWTRALVTGPPSTSTTRPESEVGAGSGPISMTVGVCGGVMVRRLNVGIVALGFCGPICNEYVATCGGSKRWNEPSDAVVAAGPSESPPGERASTDSPPTPAPPLTIDADRLD